MKTEGAVSCRPRICWTLAALVVAAFGYSAETCADDVDTKYMPGSACQAYKGSDEKYLNHVGTKLTNTTSDKTVKVTCPILRDKPQSWDSIYTGVRLINSSGYTVKCWRYMQNYRGSVTSYKSAETSAVGVTWMSFAKETYGSAVTVSLVCRLPPKSSILYIRTSEHPG